MHAIYDTSKHLGAGAHACVLHASSVRAWRWYVKNSVEPLIEGVKAAETIEYNDTVNKNEFKQSWMR